MWATKKTTMIADEIAANRTHRASRPRLMGVLAVVLSALGAAASGRLSSDQQPTQPPTASKNGPASAVGKTWKSQTTGNEYRVRVETGIFHAEWVNVPADWAERGAYLRTECRHVGGKWVGTSVSHLPCTVDGGQGTPISKWCDLKTQTEIDSISAQRITGRGQRASKVDCQQCKILEAGWADFVWTPAH